MSTDNVTYHVRDVGKILLEVQDQIKLMKAQIEDEGRDPSLDPAEALTNLLSNFENDLKTKTELVLNTVINTKVDTLPVLRASAGSTSTPPPASQAAATTTQSRLSMSQSRPAGSLAETLGLASLSSQSGNWTGVAEPRRAGRPVGGKPSTGRRFGAKLTKPNKGLKAAQRGTAFAAESEPITETDVSKGIFSLVNRGLIPSYADVGPAFTRGAPVLKQEPAAMHDWSGQFVPQSTYLPPPQNAQLSSLQLDMPTSAYQERRQTTHPWQTTRSEGTQWADADSTFRFDEAPNTPLGTGHRLETIHSVEVLSPARPETSSPSSDPAVPPRPDRSISAMAVQRNSSDGGDEQDSTHQMVEAIDKIRGYNELLDEYSLHQFIIRHGRTLEATPEFTSFKRTHTRQWGAILNVVRALEALMQRYHVPTAYIDGQAVTEIASDELRSDKKTTLGPEVLMRCIANQDQVFPLLKLAGQRFRDPRPLDPNPEGTDVTPWTVGQALAAVAIQSIFRMHRTLRQYKDHRLVIASINRWKRLWRGWKAFRDTRDIVLRRLHDQDVAWRAVQEGFCRDWPEWQRGRRVLVHIAGAGGVGKRERMLTPNIATRVNTQLARLCDIKDPNVTVVIVSPFALSKDILAYYQKLLSTRASAQTNVHGERFKVLVPENASRFPEHFPLAAAILYSPRCLRRLAHFCRGQRACIVPGDMTDYDQRLALHLQLPVWGPSPAAARHFGSKSGAKSVFAAADVNVPPGAHDVSDAKEILACLSMLIAANLETQRWILKTNTSENGRGIAYFDSADVSIVKRLRRERHAASQHDADYWVRAETQAKARASILAELRRVLPRVVRLACPAVYGNRWKNFLKAFIEDGGVVEAAPTMMIGSPSVNLVIAPDGTVDVISTQEQLLSGIPHPKQRRKHRTGASEAILHAVASTQPGFSYVGCAFPARTVPHAALRGAAMAVGQVLAKQGVIGHVGVDFVTFWDASQCAQKLWAVDLNLRPTSSYACFKLFDFLAGGVFDAKRGVYSVPKQLPPKGPPPNALLTQGGGTVERCFVAHNYLYHPGLRTIQYGSFFNLCRVQGISYDLENRVGTAFTLVDTLAGGVLGFVCAGRSYADALRVAAVTIAFLAKHTGLPMGDRDGEFGADTPNILAIGDAIQGQARAEGAEVPPVRGGRK